MSHCAHVSVRAFVVWLLPNCAFNLRETHLVFVMSSASIFVTAVCMVTSRSTIISCLPAHPLNIGFMHNLNMIDTSLLAFIMPTDQL